ncbi:hypothetical protein [Microbacterium trichothecenolyticum]|uniref:Uncharacterized protein n=1 Tax=Microbacterium trichothecenolyticum TaxID=69370 RepID=A0ABU0TXZ9_MICTR|nr:hypothetical protein [Microbacterium trichothecenolyticum]MDQ1124526.1 hypothetical protein [Microbacterium trichothecenolyticum]
MTDDTRAPQPSAGPAGGASPADAVGGAVHDESKLPARPDEQSEPKMDTHETDDEARIAGVVVQTRADVGDKNEARIADVLRQRFAEVGLDVGDDRVRALAAEVAQG